MHRLVKKVSHYEISNEIIFFVKFKGQANIDICVRQNVLCNN